MKFPNKIIEKTYSSAIRKTFTWSPRYQVFTDEFGSSSYNYWAMMWLKDNNILRQLPPNGDIVFRFRINGVNNEGS